MTCKIKSLLHISLVPWSKCVSLSRPYHINMIDFVFLFLTRYASAMRLFVCLSVGLCVPHHVSNKTYRHYDGIMYCGAKMG